MTTIKPFKGFLYSRKKITDLSKVVTPPYDVIDSKQQANYYKLHPHNFIRLVFGKTSPADNSDDNRYTRARDFFERWVKEGVLKKDEAPSIYVYIQEYAYEGKAMSRLGFISLAKLEEDRTKGFIPHERTFSGPKRDRLSLIKEVKANLSPIFSIIFDNDKKISGLLKDFTKKNKPAVSVKFEGINNRLWRLSDERLINRLTALVKNKRALIADGHHRYEVALEYRKEMLKIKPKDPSIYDYVMMYFAVPDEQGLTIMPTHRMVKGIAFSDFKKNEDKIGIFFDIISCADEKKMFLLMKSKGKHALGLCLDRQNYFCLSLKRKTACSLIKLRHSAYWRNLDVVILHNFIFEKIFGIRQSAVENMITFTRDPKVALGWVKAGNDRAAFFLNPPSLEDINNIVGCRERMPHKTTYFYPKPPSGLVINKLEPACLAGNRKAD
ncbi:MAG: DUF1015 domain-containing protein [Candidatus Omnitrophota bacterium]